jgi:hypothetical protein
VAAISQMIGYDVRRAPSPFLLSLWDTARREQFLLRTDVAYPFSVDKLVWPSRFQLGDLNPYPFPQPADAIVIQPSTVNQHFQLFKLWDDLVRMLGPYRPSSEGDCGLGVGLMHPEHYQDDSRFAEDDWWQAIHGSPIIPPEPEDEWKLLGYDVANSGFTSSVSNCGVPEAERATLRKTWGGSINQFGLFGKAEEALRFCADANVRFADDGPFYVFELFLIWSSFLPG